MFTLVLYFLAIVGLAAVGTLFVVFFGFQSKTLWSKEFRFLQYKFTFESTSGKNLTVKVDRAA